MAMHKKLKPIGDYLYDKGEMIEQMFSSIPIVEIRNMVPITLQGMPLHELKAECLVELLGISDRDILNMLDGKKERNVSSSDSEREGAFVISDDERKIPERRIKKEKKDTARKIKTEKVSSKKDGPSGKSPEPSTSKKKRKSKEIVEVNSKKKKKFDDKPPVSIPSSSRDASKAPVSKKKKKEKKDEKKKDSSKKNKQDDIVVVDDDSDREEKREEKSLLDLLELEMRARAIRSLLKKDEAVQAQKILSEYKDEPDDLIPIEIEPPQIELISDSEEEETTNTVELDAEASASTKKINEGISSKQTNDEASRSLPDRTNDDSNSVSHGVEKIVSCSDRNEIINESSPKATTKSEDVSARSDFSDPSQIVIKDCKDNDKVSIISAVGDHDDSVQSGVSDDIISAIAVELAGSSGCASQFSTASKQCTSSCVPKDKTDNRGSIDQDVSENSSTGLEKREHTSPSNKDSTNKIDAGDFLVFEEPSVAQLTDGSQINDSSLEMDKPIVETTKTPSDLNSDTYKGTESGEIVDSLTVNELFQLPAVIQVTDGSQTNDSSLEQTNEMNKPIVETTKPPSDLDSDEVKRIESDKIADSLMVQEEFQQPTVADSSQMCLHIDVANDQSTAENTDTKFVVPLHEENGANCEAQVERYSGCSNTSGANSALQAPTVRCKSTDGVTEDDFTSQFEDEVLDYDYNPIDSYCEKVSEASISVSENSPICTADCKMLSSGNSCSVIHRYASVLHTNFNDNKDNNDRKKLECISHQESNNCGVGKSETSSCTVVDRSENSAEDQIHPSDDLTSVSIHLPVKEITSDNHSLTENTTYCLLRDDSSKTSSSSADFLAWNQLETVKRKDDVRNTNFSSPELVTDSELLAVVSFSSSDTAVTNCSIQQRTAASMRLKEDLTKEEDDSHAPPIDKETHTLDTCKHSYLNTQHPGVVDKDDFSMRSSEEEAGCSEQNLVTNEHASTLSGLISSNTQNETPEKEVSDDPLVVEENISTTDKSQEQPRSSLCVTTSGHTVDFNCPLIQQTSTFQGRTNILTVPCQSFRSNNDSDGVISTVMCKPTTMISDDFNVASTTVGPKVNDDTKKGQSPDCASFAVGCTVESSISTSSRTLDPLVLSEDEIVDEARCTKLCGTHVSNTHESGEVRNSCSQDVINNDVAEIIDITGGEHVDSSDVVYVREERVDSDSLDESDNEISDKAALILEHMSTILNDANGVGDVCSTQSCQPSPGATSEGPAGVYSVNSCSSELVTDDGTEGAGSPEDNGHNTVLEISDLDDADEEETSGSKDEGTSDLNDDNYSEGSIEVIEDSESVCSIESQHDGSTSDECVMVLQPNSSISDDCIIVTEPEHCSNSNRVVVAEPEGSESDDCAIVSQPNDSIAGESVDVSHCEVVPGVEATNSMSVKTPSIAVGEDSVVVTIIIEDDGEEEEVKLLAEEVPAEIFELDDDEVKSNWTARWLESDNVKKVVQTSKILANVRKQMKIKFKKVDAPIINDAKPSVEKSAPPLIGSVEEYQRLVKEGVIISKATQSDEKPDCSNNSIEGAINPSKESSDSGSLESKAQEGFEKNSDKKKTDKKKNSEKSEWKKKSERRKKSDKREKKNSDKSVLDPSVPESSSSPSNKETETLSKVNEICEVLATGRAAEKDAAQEDGEIIESSNSRVSKVYNDIGSRKYETKSNGKSMGPLGKVVNGEVCRKEHPSEKNGDGEEREEGETSEKEDGEISESDDDSKASQKSSQPKPSPSQALSGSKECSRSIFPLSCIPLPRKPPVKQHSTKTPVKQQFNKVPERNSAAKRFILRNLQLGKKRPSNSKHKKKRKKGAGGGNRKGLGHSSNVAPKKNKPTPLPQTKGSYEPPPSQKEVLNCLISTNSSLQTVSGIQPSYLTPYPEMQPGTSMSQLGQAQNTDVNASNTAQTYDSYYSWAYSQGLISSANGNYGYGTPESTPDPNVYKQWEEYYRKLMEACKVSAEHASAGALYNFPSTSEKSGYSWVFDHSTSATQPAQIPVIADSTAIADSTTEPAAQIPAASISADISDVSPNVVPLTNEMSDKDRFESWQYRYGLKGLLKEHFVPAPNAPSTGDGTQNS